MSPLIRTILVFLALIGAIIAASLVYRNTDTGEPPQQSLAAAPTTLDESALHPEVQAGLAAMRAGHEDEALTHFQEVPGDSPDYAFALQRIAVIQARRGQLPQAQATILNLSQMRPGDPEPHATLGWLFFMGEEYERAELAALRTLELDANHLATRYNIGLYRVAQGRSQRAVASYTRALLADPSGAQILVHLQRLSDFHDEHPEQPAAHYAMAFIAGSIGDREIEAAELEHYLEIAAPSPEADAARLKLDEVRGALGGS